MSLNVELRYGSPRHTSVKEAVLARVRLSRRGVRDWHEKWRRSEDTSVAYIKESEYDALRRMKRDDSGKPQYTTIEVPLSYAMLLTAHMYWSTVFLARNPVFQYMARTGQYQSNEQAVEALIDYQVSVGRWIVPLYIWLLDGGKYGLGALGLYWDEETNTVSEIIEEPETFGGVPLIGRTKKVRRTRNIDGYRGNKIFNIRPFDFLPDTRVTLLELQRGEFCGRETEVGWNFIVRGGHAGRFFNLDAVKRVHRARKEGRIDSGSQLQLPDTNDILEVDDQDMRDMSMIKLVEMVVDVVPRQWGLGNSDRPEKWAFVLAEDEVLIEVRPLGMFHNMFPYFVLEYEIEGYSLVKRSMLDMLRPMNDILTWLFDSHFTNVRKVLNDMFIVDPSKIIMKDMSDPMPGKLIRLRPEAYGTDVRTAAHQFQVVDVTQAHMRDVPVIIQVMQRLVGVTDNIMGLVNPGGRKTATEVRTSSTLGINRLKTNAEYMSAMGFSPLAMAALQNTQQFYDDRQKLRVAGDLIRQQDGFVDVTPEGITGFYDYLPVDGTLPLDRFAMANLQREILNDALAIPGIGEGLDILGFISHIAQLSGVKNFDRFLIRAQTQPDQQLLDAARAGNVVPIGGQGGGRTAGRSEEDLARVSEPGQVTGMGTTG